MKNFYITTPIYYVNSEPHIGSVYTSLMADIIKRFKKLNNVNSRLLTGTDEHGQKIQQSAQNAGITEKDFVDNVSEKFKDVIKFMKFDCDDFLRTTEDRHVKFVQYIWRILLKNGWIYKGQYSGWYCVSDEAYYTEDELVKQDNGTFKTELGKNVDWKEEESYFFKLSEFQEILLELYKNTEFIKPDGKKNEIIAFVAGTNIKKAENSEYRKGHLQDLSISRNSFSWGIKIPCDINNKELLDKNGNWKNDIKQNEKHVIYVWLDALFNYQSALSSINKLEEFWNNADVVHFVGKDIVKFHTIYWPAFLIATKYSIEEFKKLKLQDILKSNILPKIVFAHGWWTVNGKKISKSLGNAINPKDEISWLVNNFNINKDIAIDYFRYYLSTEIPFGNDGDYSKEKFTERLNSELVNNIGNLIQRVLSMIYKNLGGKIEFIKTNCEIDFKDILQNKTINKFDFQEYRDLIINIANGANDYMEKTAPWLLKKEGKIEEMKNVLYTQVENIRKIAILLQPLCPYLSSQILDFLHIDNRTFDSLYNNNCDNNSIIIGEPKGIFPRLNKIDI